MPDPTAAATRLDANDRPPSLRAALAERIRREGPIGYDAYVAAALYDPAGGFYARGVRIGPGGAFATSPTAHPAFAAAVIAEVVATWHALGEPAALDVAEAGPGDGTLACALAAALPAALPGVALRLVLLEPAAGMRARQETVLAGTDLAVTWASEPALLPPLRGLIVANEVLDALPFRLLRWPAEVRVGLDGDRLVEVAGVADPALLQAIRSTGVEPRPGARYVVRPAATDWLAALARSLEAGRLLLVDYGGEGAAVHDGRRDPVRTYVAGGPGGDPLHAPGRQDITADVDFGDLRRAAAALRLTELRYGPQGRWLADHGVRLPPPAARDDAAWRLAGLVDERLPFQVLLLAR